MTEKYLIFEILTILVVHSDEMITGIYKTSTDLQTQTNNPEYEQNPRINTEENNHPCDADSPLSYFMKQIAGRAESIYRRYVRGIDEKKPWNSYCAYNNNWTRSIQADQANQTDKTESTDTEELYKELTS